MQVTEQTLVINDKAIVNDLRVSAYRIPTDSPESDGTLQWNSTTLVVVEVEACGETGIGYTYADAATAYFINRTLRNLVVGCDAFNIPYVTRKLSQHVRNQGMCGIAMMGISAIDSALWDVKGKIMGQPVALLLGKVRDEISVYGSGGFTSYSDTQLQNQFREWTEAGIKAVKMKIGRNPERDIWRVNAAREAIGDCTGLYVDANGAYTVKQSIQKAKEFAALGVEWFEEPVSSDNLEALRYIRETVPPPINVSAGEYGYHLPYFTQMLQAKAVDVLQADATRCGGISGFIKAGHLCEAYQIPYSSHCAPALHVHPALALSTFFIAEYFYDHVRIENMFFEGAPQLTNGVLQADLSRPGLGITFKEADAEKFEVK